MEKRDFLKDQIDQMARVLGELLSRLIDSPISYEDALKETRVNFDSELDLDFEKMLTMTDAELENLLYGEKPIHHTLWHPIARIFIQLGDMALEEEKNDEAKRIYHKALHTMEIINQKSNSFSFELNSEIEDVILKMKALED